MVINRDIDDVGLRYLHASRGVGPSIGPDRDADLDGRSAEAEGLRAETEHITHEDRFLEFNAVHCHGHDRVHGVLSGLDGAGLIDIAENYAPKYRAVSVDIARHHHDAY